jgi:pyruvate dehydrogenase E2 component (dihydrolipoamide acetyltransferase)
MERILLPKLALTMEDARLVRWLKREGERVARGEVVVEIETEKANADVESPCDGFLKAIAVPAGETAAVDAVLAYVATSADELAAPLAAVVAPATQRDDWTSPPAAAASAAPHGAMAVRAAPATRKLARDLGVDLATVRGTGPEGRITPEDVTRAHARGRSAPVDPLAARRPVIAALQRSILGIPHIHICREVRADGLLQLKKELGKTTYTELLVKALAHTVERHPVLQSALAGDELHRPPTANVGVVVDTGDGVMIPVLKDAAAKPLDALSLELRSLASRARAGRLAAAELDGATVTLSNLGMHGVDFFTAVIPYGQVGILAVGRVRAGTGAEGGSELDRPSLWLNLTVDHRLVDGVAAAQALGTLADLLHPQAIRDLARGMHRNGPVPGSGSEIEDRTR